MEGSNKGQLHPEQKKWKVPKGPKPIAHKNKNMIGLGRTIANQRRMENSIQYLPDGEMRFTTDKREADWVKLRSVTQENSLDEFLNTAQLADTDFTAERNQQVKIIKVGNTSVVNQTGLLTQQEAQDLKRKHQAFENKLTIPRRPKWFKGQAKLELERQENLAFLEWRRQLAQLSETNDLLLTPFERNLEVWRQLWRVVERCDLVVQIVDARNPLFFRSVDLVAYVNQLADAAEVPEEGSEDAASLKAGEPLKKNLLLVNKADLLTRRQRVAWAEYFHKMKINFVFFSAAEANELLEKEQQELEEQRLGMEREISTGSSAEQGEAKQENEDQQNEEEEEEDDAVRILKIEELENLFMSESPRTASPDRKLQIGLVGYPNVGKSSTINALVGSKKVSVSATPGKTKHFQTINLSDEVMLCDCPGLVFPNFAYTNGELVCNGVLPIDQLREHIPPVSLVCQRIPKHYLEALYGIHIPTKSIQDGGDGIPTAAELLNAYARARGYMTQGFGSADEPRASRYILKDYVNGKLLFVVPPPVFRSELNEWDLTTVEEGQKFNDSIYNLDSLPESRRAQILQAIHNKGIKEEDFDLAMDLSKLNFSQHISEESAHLTKNRKNQDSVLSSGPKTLFYGGRQAGLENAGNDLDREFFKMGGVQGKLSTPFHKVGSGEGSKKHGKKNKKSEKKTRVVGY
ncbi:large subunit GTPase 1 [[Candida] railenensis]|uniref:Large subunit GTPase 1 n=1 Tax=[Candida] railenensis TaxID=45579 RepID=A0A9P0VY55_9ASCO|nr:large subunit GTPase 1 [[Candida] railenensis]